LTPTPRKSSKDELLSPRSRKFSNETPSWHNNIKIDTPGWYTNGKLAQKLVQKPKNETSIASQQGKFDKTLRLSEPLRIDLRGIEGFGSSQ
jgi:hypothetical protein